MPDHALPKTPRPTASDVGSVPHLSAAQGGVRGWLLALCLMLTVIGPIISVWLMTIEYTTLSKYVSASSSGMRIAIFVSMTLTTLTIVFGIFAGMRLWMIKPNAVNIAKNALLFGVATEIITTAIHVTAGTESLTYAQLIDQTLFHMVPSLVFFTVCFGYLNKSVRVSATFSHRGHKSLTGS